MTEREDHAVPGDIAREIESAEKRIPAPEPAAPAGAKKRSYTVVLKGLQYALLLASFVYIYASLPGLKTAFAPERSIRSGPYAPDSVTDDCIRNIWAIASGRLKAETSLCPLSGSPYLAAGGKISCPSPAKHGLQSLYFSPRKGVVAEAGGAK